MWKVDARILILVLMLMMAPSAGAATCAAIWKAASTANSTVAPTLPIFTGALAMTIPPGSLGAGDFHYGTTTLSSGTLTTAATTTRLYFNGNLSLSGNTVLNSASGSPQNLIVIVKGTLSMSGSARINGLVYVTGSATLASTNNITGSLTAAGAITLGGATTTYSESGVVGASYSTLCTPPVRPALKIVNPICGVTNKILVSFDSTGGRLKLGTSATTLSNYSITNEAGATHTVSAARVSDDGYEVQLTVTPSLSNAVDYTVAVSNVKDQDGITMTSGSDSFYFSTTTNGVVGNYWSGTTFSGNPALQRVDSNINFSWPTGNTSTAWPAGSNSTGMSNRWEGYLEVPTSGNYTFQAYSEDGSRVWLNDVAGTAILDRWSSNDAGTVTGSSIALVAGKRYPLKVEMFKTGENSTKAMQLRWITPSSGTYTAIPNANLYTCVQSFASNTGLVAYYQLEGPTWTGAAGEVRDSSGNNLNGTTVRINTTTSYPTAAAAKVCNGAFTNGSNYFRIADGPLMDLTDAMSITAWIRLTSLSTELRSIFSKDENYEFHINNSRQVYWWWNNSNGTARSFVSPANSITLGTWHHIGVVYSSTRQSIYIDGVERAFTTYANEILMTNNDPMEIGADQGINDRIWNGAIDEIKLYDRALSGAEVSADMNATHACANTLGSFSVTVASTASVCAPVAVTIRALQSDGSALPSAYTGTVTITTSANHGNWSKVDGSGAGTAAGTLNPATDNDDNGSVQYTFAAADNNQVVLYLSNSHADHLTVTTRESSGTATGTSGIVQFSENAFVITTVPTTNTDFIAGRNHPLKVTAMKRYSAVECGPFVEYNGSFPLKAWITPTAKNASGAAAPFISTTSVPVQLPTSMPTSSNNVTLNFNQGVATLDWITSDVGQHVFKLRDNTNGKVVDATGAQLEINGTSDTFTVRPFGFYLNVAGNPAATSASGGAFVKAGQNFTVQATAVQYQAADDANADGQPDTNANLSDNAATPRFGWETPAESIVLTGSLVAPTVASGAINPGLAASTSSITSFTNGAGSTTTSFGEVGIISISAALSANMGKYLGGTAVTGSLPYVGRFYPDHFAITPNTPVLRDGSGAWSCNFTYQGQPFGFATEPQLTITAYNAATPSTPTVNYTDTFWKLATPQHDIDLSATGVPIGSSCLSGGVVTSACFTENSASVSRTLSGLTTYDGAATFATGAHSLQINKLNVVPNAGDVPYFPTVDFFLPIAQLTDTDGACYKSPSGTGPCTEYRLSVASNATQGTEIRYGRGWIDNTNGSVTTPLIMTLRLQYWDASGNFVYNTLDNNACSGTSLLLTNIQLSGYTGNLGIGETSVSDLKSLPGYYLMSLAAPKSDSSGQPNSGTVTVTWPMNCTTAPWLCYDYNGDGVNENPSARAIFSGLPDKRPVLFLKETYR